MVDLDTVELPQEVPAVVEKRGIRAGRGFFLAKTRLTITCASNSTKSWVLPSWTISINPSLKS